MKYKIVTAFTSDCLEKDVNQLIQNNWKPLGAATVCKLHTSVIWTQTMVIDN